MGKFSFRLESMLKIAINQEEDAKKYLAFTLSELKNGREQLLALSQLQTKALRALVEDQKGKISINKLISNHHYCQFLKSEVEKKQNEVMNLEKKVEQARENLQEIMKKRKILEKLEEKQYSSFLSEEQRNLQKELDEIASNLFYTSAGGF